MSDAAKLIKQAEALVSRLERLLPQESPQTDWTASIAFRWRKKGTAAGYIEPVRHVHKIALRDLQGVDTQKALVEQNTRQFVDGYPANNVLLTGARGTITPLAAAYRDNGVECRDFLASYVRERSEAWMQGEACRNAVGRWEVRSLRPWRR